MSTITFHTIGNISYQQIQIEHGNIVIEMNSIHYKRHMACKYLSFGNYVIPAGSERLRRGRHTPIT